MGDFIYVPLNCHFQSHKNCISKIKFRPLVHMQNLLYNTFFFLSESHSVAFNVSP
jgi:hypothetical protein